MPTIGDIYIQLSSNKEDTSGPPSFLGAGFNTVTNLPKAPVMSVEGAWVEEGEQDYSFELIKLASLENFKKSLGLSASASFSGMFGSVSASVDFFQKSSFSQYSVYMGAKIQVVAPTYRLSEYYLSERARKRLQNADLMEFGRMYGDNFISGIKTGGLFFALLEFQAESAEEMQQLNASLSGQVGSFKLSTQMNSHMESLSKKYKYTLRILKITNTTKVPIPDNPKSDPTQQGGQAEVKDPLLEAVANFPNEVSAASPAITGYETRSYEECTNLPIGQKTPDFFHFRQLLTKLAQEYDKSKVMLTDIAFIRNHPAVFSRFKLGDFTELEASLQKHMDAIEEAAHETSEYIIRKEPVPSFDWKEAKRQLPRTDLLPTIATKTQNKISGTHDGGADEWVGTRDSPTTDPLKRIDVSMSGGVEGVGIECTVQVHAIAFGPHGLSREVTATFIGQGPVPSDAQILSLFPGWVIANTGHEIIGIQLKLTGENAKALKLDYQVRTTEKEINSGHSGEMVLINGTPLGALKVSISLG